MIEQGDILCMEYLKKTEFTGSNLGMRYRLEKTTVEDETRLMATIWPEPFNYLNTPEEKKERMNFSFNDAGVADAVRWMNERQEARKDEFEKAPSLWDTYEYNY